MKVKKNWSNQEIAQLFNNLAAALIVKKVNRFQISAYENAAVSIEQLTVEAKDLWENHQLKEIAGIGVNISSHLDKLFRTGKNRHFEQIFGGLPRAMFEFLKIPGIGPKTAYKLCQELKINKAKGSLKKLKKAGIEGKIRVIEGFGEKSEKEILKNLNMGKSQASIRILLPKALEIAKNLIDYLKKCPEVIKVDPLGSLRRKSATVGDIDIGIASNQPKKVMLWLLNYPKIIKVIESGEEKARILIFGNYQIDLMIETVKSYGSLLQHLTGSKAHNIHLRKIALEKGLSLSEQGIKTKMEDGRRKMKRYSSEERFYKALGMECIPPELREDRGEIEAALKHKLPNLVKLTDIKGDLHLHSNFKIEPSHNLGNDSMENIVKLAKLLNYEYIAFSEHNPSRKNHNENEILSLIKRKKEVIDKLNYSNKNKLFIFNSIECDIRPNGERALSDKTLQLLDFAIVSIHSRFGMLKEEMTQRIIKGLSHPKAKILGHPMGRKINQREGYELNWDKIFDFCWRNNKILEISSCPDRIDLPDILAKEALKYGLKFCINTDSHDLTSLKLMKYGVFNSRRAWLKKSDIINTLRYNEIRKYLIV